MMKHLHPTIDRLIDSAHGELSPPQEAAVRAHLAECPPCAAAFEDEVRLGALLREHARAEERELPPGLATSIYARAAAESDATPWWERLAASLRPVVAIPVAAAVVAAIYFAAASGWHTNPKTDAADAAYYMETHAALATTTPFEEGEAFPTELTSDETAR